MVMRRKDREITDRSIIENILERAEICRVAMCDENMPYIVPDNILLVGNNTCIFSGGAEDENSRAYWDYTGRQQKVGNGKGAAQGNGVCKGP
jgi:nitroimidazol reductase NimA-like FMN-containing flavoprotein (pyridoxamine 5'-phosphate oxidase superfamily)